MKARKTFEIEKIKEMANDLFLNSSDCFKTHRSAVFHFTSMILSDSGNYKGFGYLSKSDVKEGFSFGIDRTTDPSTFPDETRVFFY